MYRGLFFFMILLLGLLSSCTSPKETEEIEIHKEVRMENENGIKTLYISTTQNGVVSEEVYTGKQADEKLAEINDNSGEGNAVKKEVEVEIIDGVKTVTIINSEKGESSTEVYTGAEAEVKLKELQGEKI